MKQKFLLVCVLLALNIYVDASTERGSATINDAADANPKTPTFGQAHRDDGSEYQEKFLKSVQENLLAKFDDAASTEKEEEEGKGADQPVQKYKKNEEVETTLENFLKTNDKAIISCRLHKETLSGRYYCKKVPTSNQHLKYAEEEVVKLKCCQIDKELLALGKAVADKRNKELQKERAKEILKKAIVTDVQAAKQRNAIKYKNAKLILFSEYHPSSATLSKFMKNFDKSTVSEKNWKKLENTIKDLFKEAIKNIEIKDMLKRHKDGLISKIKQEINRSKIILNRKNMNNLVDQLVNDVFDALNGN